MLAVLAFAAFLLGLALDALDVTAEYGLLLWTGLALLALHFVTPIPVPWRRP